MKHFVIIIFSVFLLNLSAQHTIVSSTNSIQVLKKNIKGNKITFEIKDSDNQPFVAFDIKVNGQLKNNSKISITVETISKEAWCAYGTSYLRGFKEKTLNEDIHFNNENSWSSQLQYLPNNTSAVTVRIENPGNKIDDIDFNFFYPNKTEELKSKETSLLKAAAPINCSCPIPAYEARSDWDPAGTHPAQSSPTSTTVTHLIVHHAAGPNVSTDWAAKVRSIWNYHVNSNGWSDIGYNYLIDPNGVIYEGRGDNILGAHFSGMNSGTMGVCLLGNYQPDLIEDIHPTINMQNSLVELLSWKECNISTDPLLSSYHSASLQTLMHISGHRDAGTGTECPGDNVYDILPNIRNSCASYIPNCAFTIEADLIVSALATNPDIVTIADNTELQVAVGNGGSADVIESINVELKVDAVTVHNFTIDSIHSGEIINLSYPNYIFSTLGSHQLCVYIGSATNEINTANNSYCITTDVLDSLTLFSDLTVQSITVSPINPEVDEISTVSFEIKNNGDLSTSNEVQAKIKIDGEIELLFNVPILNQSQTYTKTLNNTFLNEGEHQACIEIDSPDNEDNSINNSYCKTLQIEPKTISGIYNYEKLKSFSYFPNPAREEVNVVLKFERKEKARIGLFNILGQQVYSIELNQMNINKKIDLSNLERGLYFLEVELEENVIKAKIIKE